MGYTTDFFGEFTIDKEVDTATFNLLRGLAQTRRVQRNPKKLAKRLKLTEQEVIKLYGTECEWWVGELDWNANPTEDVVNDNKPPAGQPSLWCQWAIQDDRRTITWDGGEKFYEYVEWIEYITSTILAPRGYKVNGNIEWAGEESDDQGVIDIADNIVTIRYAVRFFLTTEDSTRVRKMVNDYLANPLKEVIDTKLDEK